MHRILVLKGGGLRGLLQLPALELFETHFNKPIYEIFDLIVGSSVGSITGGILATGKYPVSKYNDLFLRYIPKIFHRRFGIGLLRPIYDKRNFNHMWRNLFPNENLLMEDCKTRFLCTSINLCDFRTHFFKSWEEDDGKLPLEECIMRSFAAPYYFGPVVDKDQRAVWVDGGLGTTNTPLMIAFAESINLGWNRAKVEFTVIGTGLVDYSMNFAQARHVNIIEQMKMFLNPREGGLARVQSTINQVDLMHIIAKSNPLVDFYYYDIEVGPEYSGLDKIKHIPAYQGFGRLIADKLDKDLHAIDNLSMPL
ncbi:patatin-like phospholipase family protein [Candidatus Harpocratesius sp.]